MESALPSSPEIPEYPDSDIANSEDGVPGSSNVADDDTRTSERMASPTKQHRVFSSSMRLSVNSSSGTRVARAEAGVDCAAGALRLCIGG